METGPALHAPKLPFKVRADRTTNALKHIDPVKGVSHNSIIDGRTIDTLPRRRLRSQASKPVGVIDQAPRGLAVVIAQLEHDSTEPVGVV